MKRILLLPVLVILLVSACKEETPPPPVSPNENIPYWTIGNYWNYLVTSGPFTKYKYVEITKTKPEADNGFSYGIVTQLFDYDYHYYEDGFLKSYPEDHGRGLARTYLKHADAKVGDTWEDYHNTYILESVNDTVRSGRYFYLQKGFRSNQNQILPVVAAARKRTSIIPIRLASLNAMAGSKAMNYRIPM